MARLEHNRIGRIEWGLLVALGLTYFPYNYRIGFIVRTDITGDSIPWSRGNYVGKKNSIVKSYSFARDLYAFIHGYLI